MDLSGVFLRLVVRPSAIIRMVYDVCAPSRRRQTVLAMVEIPAYSVRPSHFVRRGPVGRAAQPRGAVRAVNTSASVHLLALSARLLTSMRGATARF